jgi:hypothetical protein
MEQFPKGGAKERTAMHINRKIEQFLRLHDMAPTTFGRRVARDPRLVLDMRNGRCLRPAMVLKAEAFMATYERHLELLNLREAA